MDSHHFCLNAIYIFVQIKKCMYLYSNLFSLPYFLGTKLFEAVSILTWVSIDNDVVFADVPQQSEE